MDVTLSQAREQWSEVIERLGHGEETVLVNTKSRQAAVLRRLEGPQPPGPVWPSTRARQELGALVAAAQEATQVLTAGGRPAATVTRHATPQAEPPRPDTATGVTGLADVLDGLLHNTPPTGLSTGVTALDRASGGLPRGSLTLVVAPPNAGGSLLPLQAARAAAFDTEQPTPVLYALSGVPLQVAARRLIAAEAPVPYAQFAAGTLTPGQRQAVTDADGRLRTAPLAFTRPEPTAQAIAEEASRIEGLGLVVVDRLQHARTEATPLSGRALPSAMKTLTRLAAERQAAVVVLLDTDDPQLVTQLEPDRTFHLTRPHDTGTARITVTAQDLGTLATVEVPLDMAHLRLLDQPASPTTACATAPVTPQPATPPPGTTPTPPQARGATPAATGPRRAPRPATPAGSARPKGGSSTDSAAVHKDGGKIGELVERIESTVHAALADAGGETEEAVAALKKTAIPDVMALLEQSRAGGRYDFRNYPDLPDILHKRGRQDADDIWEARPRWTAPPQVLDPLADQAATVTALDINGAYLSALKTHLPIGQLEHHLGPDNGGPPHDTKRSGIHLITPPAWNHPHLPNPLGDREEPGQIWITESTLRLLLRLASPKASLCERPLIHESWTSGSTEQLLETLRRALVQVRTRALAAHSAEGEAGYEYVKAMYSKLVSTMGESNYNRDLYRTDWMHLIRSQAFANLWRKAWAAHQAGLTVVRVMGTDELHLAGHWRGARMTGKNTLLFPEGREVTEVKPKHTYRLEKTAAGSYREREAN
ncbi:DnaB-like helicase C-terminal domain-containing protein [Streptomyces reniochalinae]|uniref:DnaB-like helicase C-terminal domain-containing protein n=1 Tax=Streptomyces reniochalinae TaxID=2250578 RepID=UPI0015EFEE9E